MTNIFEINKLLDCTQKLSDENTRTTRKLVEGKYYSVHDCFCNSRLDNILDLVIKFGFLKSTDDFLNLQEEGIDFLGLLEKNLDPTTIQNSFLEDRLTNSAFVQDFKEIFSKCYVDHSGSVSIWRLKTEKQNNKMDFIQLLEELKIFQRDEIGLYIPAEKNHLASYLKNRSLSRKKDYFKIQETKTAVGKEGERLTMVYEMDRLKENHDLQEQIQHTSNWDDDAGYDIRSFSDTTSTELDIYIEVKATKGKDPHFYLTNKEKAVAKELGSAYFIYLWTDVWNKPQRPKKIIRNPYEEIFVKSKEEPIVDTYLIDKKLIDGIEDQI
tara:strand:- start:2148 stop:3122 length:975 start_codon:yes stop_codon:yes gene_type:complete